MAEIIKLTFDEITLQCERCQSELIRVIIRGRTVIIECAQCCHRTEMQIDG
jgi:uncharacterized Zn finger protein